MGINGFGNNTANIMAQQQVLNNVATQAAAEQNTQVAEQKEGSEGIEAGAQGVPEEGTATATEGAVHGSSEQEGGSGQGGQGGQSQEQGGQQQGNQQGSQTQQGVQGQKGALPQIQTGNKTGQVANNADVKEVASAMLSKADATSTDIEGVKTTGTQQTPKNITLDFSRPNIEMPEKAFSTAELMMEMIRLGTESFEQGVNSQSEAIKTRTQTRLLDIKEKATEMQEYYNKVRQSNKSPIIAFFEGLGKLFRGDIEGAKDSFKTAWENGKNMLISLVVGIAALALTALTGGGAAPLLIGVMALVIGTVFTDPGLMKELVSAMGVDANSEFGKKLVNALCIVATVVSMVMSFGSNPSALMKGIGKGFAKLIKDLGKNVGKGFKDATKNAMKNVKSNITDAIADAQKKISEQGAKLSARAQKLADGSSAAIQAGGGAAQTALGVEQGIKTAQGMEARARAQELQIRLDNQQVDEEKSNNITSMLMDQYREMMDTLIGAVSSLNASIVNAARA